MSTVSITVNLPDASEMSYSMDQKYGNITISDITEKIAAAMVLHPKWQSMVVTIHQSLNILPTMHD